MYSVHTLHDVIGVQPCIGWDHLAPSPGVDPAAGDRFIHRTPKSLFIGRSGAVFLAIASQMMQIVVPPGLPPDRKLVVATPAGMRVAIQVPPGVMPGQTIQVQVPGAAAAPPTQMIEVVVPPGVVEHIMQHISF